VANRSLAAIFTHLIRLQNLNINNCSRITDSGFVGFGINPAPISRLTELQKSSFRCSAHITNASLTTVFQFRNLQGFLWDILPQLMRKASELWCPILQLIKEIEIISCPNIYDEAVTHIVDDLPRLRYMNLSNCIKLTTASLISPCDRFGN